MPKVANVTSEKLSDEDILKISEQYSTIEAFLYDRCMGRLKRGEDPDLQLCYERLGQYITSTIAPQPQSGVLLYQQASEELRVLPTGCESLDELFGHGVREGQVSELVGESASGKTQVLMQLAAVTALRGEGVIFFDLTNSFRAERVLRIAAAASGLRPEVAGSESFAQEVLSNIAVLRTHDIHNVLYLMDMVARALEQRHIQVARIQDLTAGSNSSSSAAAAPQQAPGRAPHGPSLSELLGPAVPSLLIMDSISSVVTPVLGGKQHSQGHVLMLSLSRMVKQCADRYKLAAVVSNHVVGGGGSSIWPPPSGTSSSSRSSTKPALGEHWRNQCSWRVQLSIVQSGGMGMRVAERLASPLHGPGAKAWFRITEEGLISIPPQHR
jgi:RAD51-like protein 3